MGSSGSEPAPRRDSASGEGSGQATGGPVVGISTYVERARWGVWDTDAVLLPRTYVDGVRKAGGTPVLLPSIMDLDAAAALSAVDALVLAGGADVDPRRYDAEPEAETVTRPERDAAEFSLLREALRLGMPVLGVCRGMEVLNVACGGSLTQHLPGTLGNPRHQPSPGVYGTTTVTLRPGSRTERIIGGQTKVRCYHHQAVDRLGDGLRVTGWADDGTIEAIEPEETAEETGERFLLGVQWHPEQDGEDGEDVRLFTALVRAARERKGTA